jgi:cytochrome c551/c552
MNKTINKFTLLFFTVALSHFAYSGSLRDEFARPDKWENVADVAAQGKSLKVTKEGEGLLINGRTGRCRNITTKKQYKDIEFHLEFMLAEKSNAGVYFMGRYEIQILDTYGRKKWTYDSLGGLYQRWPPSRGAGVAPKVNACKKPGEWQTMDVIFRAPRFAKDGRKISQALFREVRINGQLVHENLYAVGPTRSSQFNDEGATGPIMIQGDHGPIAIRNMKIKEVDLSDIKTKQLSAAESRPLDNKGSPMIELVTKGKEIFTNKGCIECHDTSNDDSIVKTGPSLYSIFQKTAKKVKVMESAEQHLIDIAADKEYLVESLRDPTYNLSLNKKDKNKPYLPIMPVFNAEILKASDIDALYAYLLTINPQGQQGPQITWASQTKKQYNIMQDKGAVIVKDRVRIQRAPISSNSARTYYVGLPGNVNFSFDPRVMGVSQVWNGPFVRIGGMMDGRGKNGEYGKGAKVWNNNVPFFSPYLQSGEFVDNSFKDSVPSGEFVSKELQNTEDFVQRLKAMKTEFLGLTTAKKSAPTFRYTVEQNEVEIHFEASKKNTVSARLNLKLKTAQSFSFPSKSFKNIKVSSGRLNGDKWTLAAGDYKNVTFTATRKETFRKVFSAGEESVPRERLNGQKLVWSKGDQKEHAKAAMSKEYTLFNGKVPTDTYGSKQLFEPLGIAFLNEDVAFVTTRTAGVWKVVKGEWHLFSEGHYDSLGLVIESENSIVIGEKPGLVRLTDKDGDHWADERQSVSEHFRFYGNYHEYLHGPIPYKDGYLYALNLTHNLPNNYKAGGKYMGTGGGLKGWMCQIDGKGNFNTFASGFRSPAGLALSPQSEIFYTENQGEYVGTSKIFKVKEGKFYGNPTGLVDLPEMTPASKEIQWDAIKDKRELPLVLLPHGEVMNSPGNPTWNTKGKFGPFTGQMFLGDQTLSCIYRIDSQKVNGIDQGVVMPFAEKLASGVMRLTFSPDGKELWVGQTGRGWRSRGGAQDSLQKISFNGGIPNAIQTVKVTKEGFGIHFTLPQSTEKFGNIECSSWFYTDTPGYGSGIKEKRYDKISSVSWSKDKKVCSVKLSNFVLDKKEGTTNTSRVYKLDLGKTAFGQQVGGFLSKAYYTLHEIPKN